MNEEEIKSLRELLAGMVDMQTSGGFKNNELSRRERIKEKLAYLIQRNNLSSEEISELDYCKYLVDKYYIDNPIV